MRKHGLKVLGLALMAAAGLMAFSATAALAVNLEWGDKMYVNGAEGPAEFLVNSGTLFPTGLTAGVPNSQAVKGTQIGSGALGIPGKSAELVCSTGEITGDALNEYKNWSTNAIEQGGHAHATLKFSGCKTEEINPTTHALTGKTLTNCVPNGTGIVESNVLLLAKRHEGSAYLVAYPLENSLATHNANLALTSTFATLTFSELCSLPSPVKITGAACFKAPAADAIKPVLKIDTLPKAEQELCGTKLKFGANEAWVKAEVQVELTANPGVPWGVM